MTGDNGLLSKTSDAKVETVIGTVKEALRLEQGEKVIDNKNLTPELLLAEGKVTRTLQLGEDNKYYMYYALKENAYNGMDGLGKGNLSDLKDVFLIDDRLNVRYISKDGKAYGDEIEQKILNDETRVRFSSKAFSEYMSQKLAVEEENMTFGLMKNQTKLTIADANIYSLQDLVFFPNLIHLTLGGNNNTPPITTMDGIEKCTKLKSLIIISGPNKDYTAISSLTNLTEFARSEGNDFNNIIEVLKLCKNLENVRITNNQIKDMSRIMELGNLKILDLSVNLIEKIEGLQNMSNLTNLTLTNNKITKIEGLENLLNLKKLDLSNNKISDITPLTTNSSLTSLYLTGNKEIEGDINKYTDEDLEKLNKIGEILDKNGEIYLDVDKLGLFTNYKKLNLAWQNLTTLEPLRGMTELTSLIINNNQLTLEDSESQEILRSMINLTELNLMNNKVTDVTAINNLKKLKKLNLNGTENNINLVEIQDIISNLDNLGVSTESLKTILNCNIEKITKLRLSANKLTEIPNLTKFTKLKDLSLYANENITNLNIVSKLSSLEILNLERTNLHGRMIDFSELTNLKTLNLGNNTLWDEDLENLKTLKNNAELTIQLYSNSIREATALLELNRKTKIILTGNVNLTAEAKANLQNHFENITF